jgi:uncharacterized protein (TIGR02246 family)
MTPLAEAQNLPAAGATQTDEAQIRTIFEAWQRAWNAHDMAALGRLFHDDGTWILWTGGVWVGRASIEQGMTQVHRTVYRESTQLMRVDEVRIVAPGVAVVRALTTLTGDSRAPDQTIRGRKLFVVTQREGIWRIAYGQNTRLADNVAE